DISYNSDLTATGNVVVGKDEGIVGHVASTLASVLIGDMAKERPQWEPIQFGTQSALLVPILFPGSNLCRGVLALETHNPNWFCVPDITRLQSLAIELVPDFIVYSALKDAEDEPLLGSWHYRVDGWSIDNTISDFCDYIRNGLRTESGLN